MVHSTFSKKLKELREERNITQGKLAERIGISRRAYIGYEKGATLPDVYVIVKLCKFFDVTSDYLLGLSETKTIEYSKIAETTGLSENAIKYLENNVDIDVDGKPLEYSNNIPVKDVLSFILEDADALPRKRIKFVDVSPTKKSENKNAEDSDVDEVDNQPIEENYNYTIDEIPVNLTPFESELNRLLCIYDFKDEYELKEFWADEQSKSHFFNEVINYLRYDLNDISLMAKDKFTKINENNRIIMSVGKLPIFFPSDVSNDIFDYVLTQRVLDSLKELKKIYLQKNKNK